jgi:hypothetical protein
MDEDTVQKKDNIDNIKIFKTGTILILLLLLLLASFSFYNGMHSAIYAIFNYQYSDLIGSIFDLAVIIAVLYIVREFFLKK